MKRRLSTLCLVLLGLSLIGLSGQRHNRLLELREELHLNEAAPLENMKPGTAVVVIALGAFRGIIADVLWVRATRMQEEGQYFELVQLANWITQLEPRFPEVWAFQGWNMAYNISVLFSTPEDRWRWVRHGIELLRDEGLYHNPASPALHWELGWFFQHKIGQQLDQMHWYYKTQWYNSMNDLFEGAAPDYFAWVDAPDSAEALRRVPGMEAALAELTTQGFAPMKASILKTLDSPSAKISEEAKSTLKLYHKRRQLETVYKMDLSTMEEIDLLYGPLDWRTPFSHSVYWAFSGIEKSRGHDQVRLRRMIFQSLAQAFRYGTYYPNENGPYYTPNLAMLDNSLRAYEEALESRPDDSTYQTAHKNFVTEAVAMLDIYGQRDRAYVLYELLQERYPDKLNAQPYEDFIIYLAAQEDISAMSPSDAVSFIEGMLVQSLAWETLDQPELAAGLSNQAKRVYAKYMEAKSSSEAFTERMGLPPFQELLSRARERARQSLKTRNTP